jgi:hypothetical protein
VNRNVTGVAPALLERPRTVALCSQCSLMGIAAADAGRLRMIFPTSRVAADGRCIAYEMVRTQGDYGDQARRGPFSTRHPSPGGGLIAGRPPVLGDRQTLHNDAYPPNGASRVGAVGGGETNSTATLTVLSLAPSQAPKHRCKRRASSVALVPPDGRFGDRMGRGLTLQEARSCGPGTEAKGSGPYGTIGSGPYGTDGSVPGREQ